MRNRLRLAILWAPFWVIWVLLCLVWPGQTLTSASVAATAAIGAAALLGMGAWWFTGVYRWPAPEALGFKFYGIHLLASSAFALIWVFVIVGVDALRAHKNLLLAVHDWSMVLGWYFVLGVAIYGLISGVSYTIRTRDRLREQERLAAEARLAALRNQLNPHFLFNALHSVAVLVRNDPAAAQVALEQLGELLRYTLAETDGEEVHLSEEWRFTKTYLDLEQIRFGPRLTVVDQLAPETLSYLVPSFTLQILAENAVRHGIGPLTAGGVVTVRSRVENNRLTLEVTDTGAGNGSEGATLMRGRGLKLLRERLAALYGEGGKLVTHGNPGAGFKATVTVPAKQL